MAINNLDTSIHIIKKISVTKLFGYLNYDIDTSENSSNNLLIIYGDNGSGKTTLLKMIFYLLSPIIHGGHKTSLSQIKFSKLSVTLSDGTEIYAERPSAQTIGSYNLVLNDGVKPFEVFLEVNTEGSISVSKEPRVEEKYMIFIKRIELLGVKINFLSDDREIMSFASEIAGSLKKRVQISQRIINEGSFTSFIEKLPEDHLDLPIRNLELWVRNNVIKGSKQGEENANSAYQKLIKKVSDPRFSQVNKKQVITLVEKIIRLQKESKNYYDSGLISEIEIGEFETALKTATKANLMLVYNILEPYIEGLQQRLNSLSSVQNILSKFLNSVNNYFTNKTISYFIDSGFIITNSFTGEKIEFHNLSSGEKQLIQLFSSVITASDIPTIFVIDEPEISLNVKWQRKLITTLLNLARDKSIQFILASHSIELLSGHRPSVFKLVNKEDV